jgi:hypothetical protein
MSDNDHIKWLTDEVKKLTEQIAELRPLVILGIPESRLPVGVVYPPRKPVYTLRDGMDKEELLKVQQAEVVRSLRYLVALSTQERAKRRLPGNLNDFSHQGFFAIESTMGVMAPLPPITYRSALVNLLTMRASFKHERRDAVDKVLRGMEDAGVVICKPLCGFLPKSGSEALAVMLAKDQPVMDLLQNGPPFSLMDVKRAIQNGTEWWLDGGDPWSGPQEVQSRESAAPAPGGVAEGWAAFEEPEEEDLEVEPVDVPAVPVKKKPVAAPGSWAVGGNG